MTTARHCSFVSLPIIHQSGSALGRNRVFSPSAARSDPDRATIGRSADAERVTMPLEPVEVEYCSLCGCPPEYCENAGCKRVKLEKEMEGASVSDGDAKPPVDAPAAEGDAPAAEGEEKKESGKKKKEKKAKGVTITRTTRNKKKTITNVAGLEHYPEVKIAECAKTLGKKFACGASVTKGPTGKDEIDVQGDFSHEIADLLAEKFGVDRETTKVVDKGRH